ncbi:MAG: hypothetical protein D6690_15790 [Nitrospirae bacterium]|nr:MAG: hypothetical protein D6690_15790 [Nitrospirota bacterium]
MDAPYVAFQRLAQRFNEMMDRLQTVFESQRRFVADAAHELKTPLTAIKANMEVALHRARTIEDYRDTLATTLGEVERLIALDRSLPMLAHHANGQPGHRQSLDLGPLIRQLIADVSILADERGCELIAQ